jgi:hypothetical protein
MGIGLVIIYLLPFPVDMLILFGVLFLINLFRRRRKFMQRYSGKGGIRGLFGLSSSLTSGNSQKPLRYFCMSCGRQHTEIACPNCGSKMKRVG